VIFGIGAAAGWGVADLWAAISGRRIGAFTTAIVAQMAGAVVATILVFASRVSLAPLDGVASWLVPSALLMAGGYFTLYRGLELGPVAVVSPVLASYAIFPVLLAMLLLGESLTPLVVVGMIVTVAGTALTSTDLRAIATGTHRMPPGLPWAIASVGLFGTGAYVFGWAAQRAGWLPTLWLSRMSTTAVFLVGGAVASLRRRDNDGRGTPSTRALAFAALIGLIDLAGGTMYGRGAEVGYISIVSAASATYPIVPVLGSTLFLRERPAPNQYLGVALVVGGLLAVGLG
jgi:drug/metabolite transporter (DMT)-like permease